MKKSMAVLLIITLFACKKRASTDSEEKEVLRHIGSEYTCRQKESSWMSLTPFGKEISLQMINDGEIAHVTYKNYNLESFVRVSKDASKKKPNETAFDGFAPTDIANYTLYLPPTVVNGKDAQQTIRFEIPSKRTEFQCTRTIFRPMESRYEG